MNRFLEENAALPAALRDFTAFYRSGEGAQRLADWVRMAQQHEFLQFSGMGSSEFASEAIAWRLAARGKPARSLDSGELYSQAVTPSRVSTLFILTSQSGESVEIRNLAGRPAISPCVAITNNPASFLAKASALVLPLCAGEECSITTKTFSNTIALIRLLEFALLAPDAVNALFAAFDEAANAMETVDEEGIEQAADRLLPGNKRPGSIAFIGRTEAAISARQSALTFMEGHKKPTSAYVGGAFRHGPFESVGPDLGLVIFMPSGPTLPLNESLAIDAADKGSPVVLFDGTGDLSKHGCAGIHTACARIRVPHTPQSDAFGLFPLLAARSHNQLLHVMAARAGLETGVFRYGGKITAKE